MPLRDETHLPPASDAGLGRGGESGGCVYRQPREEPGLCETGEGARDRGGREARSAPWGWRRRSRGQPVVDRGHGQLEVGLGQAGDDLVRADRVDTRQVRDGSVIMGE